MKRISNKTFTALLTLGLNVGYTDKSHSIDEVKKHLQKGQEIIKNENNIVLSAKLTPCEIVFLGQDEQSVDIQFIQYPKFPVKEDELKNAIIQLAEYMMTQLEQNRVVIVFTDETVMLEHSEAIDPRIKLQ